MEPIWDDDTLLASYACVNGKTLLSDWQETARKMGLTRVYNHTGHRDIYCKRYFQ